MEDSVSMTEAEALLHPKEEENKVEKNGGDDDQGGGGGGFVSQIVTKFAPKVEEEKEGENGENNKEGGGILENFISNLVSPRTPKGGGVSETQNGGEDGGGGSGGGGGIIDSIVANLPTSLPEDAAPTTDEASILIHSIIHD